MRRAKFAVLLVGIAAIVAISTTTADAAPRGQRPGQATTVPDEPTTVEPTTIAPSTVVTTTLAPSTTEAPTPATEPATTPSTTTTVPAASSSSDSSSAPWRWIIAILALLAVALIVVLVLVRRSAGRAKSEWKNAAASSLRNADLTRDMLADEAPPGGAEDATRLLAVREAVNRVAASFDQLAASAPNDTMRQHSIGVATSIRGFFFALEAEQMLHNAPTAPTADQLATADATKRSRATDLDTAMAALRAYAVPDPQR